MSTTVNAPAIVVLTADTDRRAKLERKLKEYAGRLAFRAPETDPHGWYKMHLLECLLQKGDIDVPAMIAEFRVIGWYDEFAFADALGVIAAYNSGDLSSVTGGTGLK